MSIIELLEEKRIVSFFVSSDNTAVAVEEQCDCWFSVKLNKNQMMELAAEITAIADKLQDHEQPTTV